MKIKKWELWVILTVVFTVLLSCVSFAFDCGEIRKNVLRLHILANSDSENDQQLKLMVRDRLLRDGAELFTGSMNESQAAEAARQEIARLKAAAQDEIIKNGYTYSAEVEVAKTYFETRTYDGVTLPAGEYEAVCVSIGDARGNNWWCVMFPPMCLPAAQSKREDKQISDVLSDTQTDIVENKPKYEIRFKSVEVFEGLKRVFGRWI